MFPQPVVSTVLAGEGGPDRLTFRFGGGESGLRLLCPCTRLPGETSCLTLVWAVLDRASRSWRGLTMTADGLRLLQDLPRQLRPRTVAASQDAGTPASAQACNVAHG